MHAVLIVLNILCQKKKGPFFKNEKSPISPKFQKWLHLCQFNKLNCTSEYVSKEISIYPFFFTLFRPRNVTIPHLYIFSGKKLFKNSGCSRVIHNSKVYLSHRHGIRAARGQKEQSRRKRENLFQEVEEISDLSSADNLE